MQLGAVFSLFLVGLFSAHQVIQWSLHALLAQQDMPSKETAVSCFDRQIFTRCGTSTILAEANQDRAEREMQARDPEGNNLHGILRVIFCIQGNDTTSTQL